MPLTILVILLVLIVAGVTVFVLANRARSSTGSLSRETRKRDAAPSDAVQSTSTELEATGRERSDETREALGGGGVARRGRGTVIEYEPVDEEEIGVTRRQFLNRGLVAAVGLGLTGFGAACLAFLWPLKNDAGFGGQINIGKLTDIKSYIQQQRKPFYAPNARTYVVLYPQNPQDLAKAKKAYKPPIYKNMSEMGIVALYQRCVHLGCRVPFCESSQWFECPCHGSKYNRVGEKKAGPAPRGLDRFYATNGAGGLVVDTGNIILGPPIGTNTTGQNAEGPLCV